MNAPPLPPPLTPPAGRNRLWIVLTVLGLLVVLGLVGAGIFGVSVFRRVKERQVAREAAVGEIQKAGEKARAEMADSLENGETGGSDAAIGRLKEQMEKSAAQMGPDDALAARAMAKVAGKLQAEAAAYEKALARLTEAEVFSFKLSDKATLETHRQLVRDFLASNARLTDNFAHGEQVARAALDEVKAPPRVREAAVKGFVASRQQIAPAQLRIRQSDKVLGESCLSIFDLLEKQWGKWGHDPASGQLSFQDDAARESFNSLVGQIEAAAEEQAKAQKELVSRMRNLSAP